MPPIHPTPSPSVSSLTPTTPTGKGSEPVRVAVTKQSKTQDPGLRIARLPSGKYCVERVTGLFRRVKINIREGDVLLVVNGTPANQFASEAEVHQCLLEHQHVNILAERPDPYLRFHTNYDNPDDVEFKHKARERKKLCM